MSTLRSHVLIIAACLLLAQCAMGAIVAFGPGDDQVLQWEQSNDAVTLVGNGFLGQRFVRLEAGGSIATLITSSALENAVYGMTAALARFSAETSWTLEVFAGGELSLEAGTPTGSTLLISASGGDPDQSDEDNPVWAARGTGDSSAPVTAGIPIWGRIRAEGGSLGIDSVLGVENTTAIWYPGENPATISVTNWDFENDLFQAETPEPSTFVLFAAGLTVFGVMRRRRS